MLSEELFCEVPVIAFEISLRRLRVFLLLLSANLPVLQ